MAFIRVRTVKGRKYYSLEERYREGGKVKSRYLGAIGRVSLTGTFKVEGKAWEVTEEMLKRHNELEAEKKAAEQAALDKVYTAIGLVPHSSSPPVSPPEQPQPAEQSDQATETDQSPGE